MIRWVPAWVCIGILAAGAQGGPTDPPTMPPAAAKALATSLAVDAAPGYVPEDVRTFIRKAAVLAAMAVEADPDCALGWRVGAEAAKNLRDYPQAASAQRQYLRLIGGRGYEAGTLWIRYSLAVLGSAEERIAMLNTVTNDANHPASLRAVALVNLAAIEEGRGDLPEAISLYAKALKLDPIQDTAIKSLARLADSFSPADQVRTGLGLLRGNPLAINVAWEVGQLCRELGLYDRAVVMYDYAKAVSIATGMAPAKVFGRDRLDCLIDAGQYQRAVDEFAAMGPSGVADLQIAGMLVEANRQLNRPAEVAALVALMEDTYRPREAVASTQGLMASELAWFQLMYRMRTSVAANWAGIAMQSTPDDEFTLRVWGMTRLGTTDDARALEILQRLAKTDPYAAATLVDDAFTRGDVTAGRKYMADTDRFLRRGPAWRYLVRVAAKHGAVVPDPPVTHDSVAALVDSFIAGGTMEMGRSPGKFISVTLTPVAAVVRPGEAPQVKATLTNIGSLPIPLGEWGLLTPKLMLDVRMWIPREQAETLGRVPLSFEAPRLLGAGESLTQVVSLDTGWIGVEMAYRPLSKIELTVTPMVDPVERNGRYVGALPAVTAPAVVLVRESLIEIDSPDAYWEALAQLVRELQGDDQVAAMRAADVTVSLLALAQKVSTGHTGPAGKLARRLRHRELLAMLDYALRQTPAAVRCRTLGALRNITATQRMLKMVGPSLASTSPLVRALAVEVLGSSERLSTPRMLEPFADQDPDPLVREMARIVIGKPSKP